MRRVLAAVAVAAALGAIAVATSSDAKSAPKPQLRVVQVFSKLVKVPPNGGPVHVRAMCPKGYVVTGGGIGKGALDFSYANTTIKGQGYEVSYFNPSSTNTYSGGTQAICAKGKGSLSVKAAGADDRQKADDEMRQRFGR